MSEKRKRRISKSAEEKSLPRGRLRKGQRQSAFIIQPNIRPGASKASDAAIASDRRSIEDVCAEARGLARAIDLDILDLQVVSVPRIQPGYFLGPGQRDSMAAAISSLEPDVVIVNHNLSPVQQRNLEKIFHAKVIDRTGLILEIFGARAQTREGILQVELAALAYQRSRLVRSWTHLERQRGGVGFMGGPGETQIELDRRMISEKITRLKKQLEEVRRTRDLARKSRERVPFPVISLVGYTNAGKSTLFNALTRAGVLAKDLLFATLDPMMRRIKMPGAPEAIIADTVGFISDLPTHLVESFRATLEQIAYADVIAHVIDVSRPDAREQAADVRRILGELGISYDEDPRIVEIWNKADLLPAQERQSMHSAAVRAGNAVLLSATKMEGVPEMLALFGKVLGRDKQRVVYDLPATDGKAIAWLHAHAHIIKRADKAENIAFDINISVADLSRFESQFGYSPRPARASSRKKAPRKPAARRTKSSSGAKQGKKKP